MSHCMLNRHTDTVESYTLALRGVRDSIATPGFPKKPDQVLKERSGIHPSLIAATNRGKEGRPFSLGTHHQHVDG